MISINLGFICGVSIGIEAITQDACDHLEVAWGLIIDAVIFRLAIYYEYPDEKKPT